MIRMDHLARGVVFSIAVLCMPAPEAASGIWRSPERFFRGGGARNWSSLLDERAIAHFNERLRELAGEATDWVLRGRVSLENWNG